uniref:Uncharacterized protein n=1 Tax=Oryza punctata TaxID=4537 RepID=A0A0E0MMA6_ORYPU
MAVEPFAEVVHAEVHGMVSDAGAGSSTTGDGGGTLCGGGARGGALDGVGAVAGVGVGSPLTGGGGGTLCGGGAREGAAHNLLGRRVTLLANALTYPLYAASFPYYNHHHSHSHQAFPVTAGALFGARAGLLWAAQGAIMTSYPPPSHHGSYISIFYGVLGGLLPFSLNYHRSTDAASVNNTTYVDFRFASGRRRGLCRVVAVAVVGTAIWGSGLANQLRYNDGELTSTRKELFQATISEEEGVVVVWCNTGEPKAVTTQLGEASLAGDERLEWR